MSDSKKGVAVVEIIFGILVLAMLASFFTLVPMSIESGGKALLKKCAANLRSLGQITLDILVNQISCSKAIPEAECKKVNDPLPTGNMFWKYVLLFPKENMNSQNKKDVNSPQKDISTLYSCPIRGVPPQGMLTSYRGPKDPLSKKSYIGGDDLFDHGKEKGMLINVLLPDMSIEAHPHDDPDFVKSYEATTSM
jgi:hypothetical protein